MCVRGKGDRWLRVLRPTQPTPRPASQAGDTQTRVGAPLEVRDTSYVDASPHIFSSWSPCCCPETPAGRAKRNRRGISTEHGADSWPSLRNGAYPKSGPYETLRNGAYLPNSCFLMPATNCS